MNLGALIIIAVISFVFTNIDDFCVLVIYFAKAVNKDNMSNIHVVVGQSLGFTVLVAISSIGIVLGSFIPPGYVEFIGFIPFYMGIKKLRELLREGFINTSQDWRWQCCFKKARIRSDVENVVRAVPNVDEDNDIAISNNDHNITNINGDSDDDIDDPNESFLARSFMNIFKYCIHPWSLEVAAVTIANGGDNVSLYLPILATAGTVGVLIIIIVWYILLVVWLVITRLFVNCKAVAKTIETNGKYFLPFLYMGLGMYVLSSCIIVQKYIIK